MASTGAAAVSGDAKNVWQTKCDRRDEFNCIQLCVGLGGGSAGVVTVSRYKLIFPLLVPAGHQPRLLSQIKPEPSRAFISLLSFPVRESAAQLSAAPWPGSSLHASTRLSTFSVIGNICQSPSHISAEEFLLILSSSHQHMNLQFSFLFDFANHQYFSGLSHKCRFPIRQKHPWIVNSSFRYLISIPSI